MSSSATSQKPSELRLRHPHGDDASKPAAASVGASHSGDTSHDLNFRDDDSDLDHHADSKPTKTYGRTPDGTVFTVPTTHDMVSQLLDPRQPKNLSDAGVLAILLLHFILAYMLPAQLKRPVFALVFIFWRASYNIGIGYLLNVQSNHRRMETWARRAKVFQKPEDGNPRPWLYGFLKREFEAKIPEDYDFDKAPLEYNTWLLFRRLVDLILMCDFVSYCLFALLCSRAPPNEFIGIGIARWSIGIGLFFFNLWVKLDAHRVVKDYAWYWGDFFFLIDQELTFDGVFEMAPHPMYSIGYAGYYGISMMAASYEVLFISIVAHLAQLAFLVVVENPHIEKTYNPPPPRKRTISQVQREGGVENAETASIESQPQPAADSLTSPHQERPSEVHRLLGWKNLDMYRTTDYAAILLAINVATVAAVTPNTPLYQFLFAAHAFAWRLWYSFGLGVILTRQSENKAWTRHFLKYGESTSEGWRQWKGLYYISMVMCYTTFMAACWKMYALPEDWSYGWVLLKHVIGASLVALQIWTAVSVYDSLGEFGWFFGDFFFDHEAKLTYRSIYRFLNNPERVFGTAGLWGAAMITWSRAIFLLALMSQILTIGFISLVEKPHMQKIYGRNLRREAGLTKFIKRSLPPPVKGWQESVDTFIDETTGIVEDFMDATRPKLAGGVKTFVRDTSALFNKYPGRLTITRLAPDLAGYDAKDYSLEVVGTPTSLSAASERATGKESVVGRVSQSVETVIYEYGAPLRVQWRAPANHSKRDWIGLYMVTHNRSRDGTNVSSLGRWAPTNAGVYDAATADSRILVAEHPVSEAGSSDAHWVSGEVEFKGDLLWWTQGVFEFRYHHDGNHSVMAISQPFEIRIGKIAEDEVHVDDRGNYEKAIESYLLPMVQNCLDRDPDIAPSTVDEPFGSHVERDSKYAKRVVYAIQHMFGIEFTPAVVPADGNVKKLAWRICNAKQVLAPYSMSSSNGATTPTTTEFPIDK